jgi:hypothetical protein
MAYVAWQSAMDAARPAGRRCATRSHFLAELADGFIDVLAPIDATVRAQPGDLHSAEIDDEPVVAEGCAGNRVTAAPYRQRQAVLARHAHAGNDIRDIRALSNCERSPIDTTVPDAPRAVVAAIGLADERPTKQIAQSQDRAKRTHLILAENTANGSLFRFATATAAQARAWTGLAIPARKGEC